MKTGYVKSLVSLIAAVPWWLWTAFAVFSWSGSAYVSGEYAGTTLRYLLVTPFVLLALWSALRKLRARRARRMPARTVSRPHSRASIGSREFLMVVGEAFRRCGFSVVEDVVTDLPAGVDFMLENGNHRILVQCAQWKAFQVGVPPLRDLQEQVREAGAHGGYVVTCGSFSDEARQFARAKGIGMVDGQSLRCMIRGTLPPEAKVEGRA